MTNFEKVGIFMKTFGQEVKTKAELSNNKINELRISLINEELEELKKAIEDNDILEVADALTDILYVAYGAGHAFGINLDKCFNEVQESNMSKLRLGNNFSIASMAIAICIAVGKTSFVDCDLLT